MNVFDCSRVQKPKAPLLSPAPKQTQASLSLFISYHKTLNPPFCGSRVRTPSLTFSTTRVLTCRLVSPKTVLFLCEAWPFRPAARPRPRRWFRSGGFRASKSLLDKAVKFCLIYAGDLRGLLPKNKHGTWYPVKGPSVSFHLQLTPVQGNNPTFRAPCSDRRPFYPLNIDSILPLASQEATMNFEWSNQENRAEVIRGVLIHLGPVFVPGCPCPLRVSAIDSRQTSHCPGMQGNVCFLADIASEEFPALLSTSCCPRAASAKKASRTKQIQRRLADSNKSPCNSLGAAITSTQGALPGDISAQIRIRGIFRRRRP